MAPGRPSPARKEPGSSSGAAKWGVERMVYAIADRVIVMSEAFAALAERDYGVNPARLRVVPGAADLRRFMVSESRGETRRALDWPRDRPVLVTVRRLIHRTGVDRLIDALVTVAAAVPDVLLYIGGIGPLRPALEARVAALRLQRHVTFLGLRARRAAAARLSRLRHQRACPRSRSKDSA